MSDLSNQDLKSWLASKKLTKLLSVLNDNEIDEVSDFLALKSKEDIQDFAEELNLKVIQKRKFVKAVLEIIQPEDDAVQIPVQNKNNNNNNNSNQKPDPESEEEAVGSHVLLLKQWKLGQYIGIFNDEGYDNIDLWSDLTVQELKQDLQMKAGHAKQFLKMRKTLEQTISGTSSVPVFPQYPEITHTEVKENELDFCSSVAADEILLRKRRERRAANAHLIGDKNYVPLLQSRNDHLPSKTIMVIGETGTGKTTLLNSMMNYLYEVEFNDPYRFKLIKDESQTDVVTPYLLSPPVLDYDLTVIDTPGFGDSRRGMAHDKRITQDIRNCFENEISSIDAICFVIRAPQARLTATQRYIFSQVLGIFGADIKDNIFILLTFADQKKPPAIAALKAGRIPFVKYFKLNNCAFDLPEEEEDDEDPTGSEFAQMFWVMGMSAFEKLFLDLNKMEKNSLTMTKQVLKRRQQLEIYMQSINPVIDEGFDILGSIRAQILIIDKCSAEVDANQNFTMRVSKSRRIKKPITGHYTNICESCQWTCHLHCSIPNEGKNQCSIMGGGGYCTICPNSCHWSKHTNQPYVWVAEKYFVELDIAELKAKYFDSKSKVSTSEQIIDGMTVDFEEIENKLNLLITNVRLCLNELSDIALRPNVMTLEDYIEKLIVTEENSRQVGWQGRVAALRKIMQNNQMITAIQGQNYDPFANFKDVQKHMKKKIRNSNKPTFIKKKKCWFDF